MPRAFTGFNGHTSRIVSCRWWFLCTLVLLWWSRSNAWNGSGLRNSFESLFDDKTWQLDRLSERWTMPRLRKQVVKVGSSRIVSTSNFGHGKSRQVWFRHLLTASTLAWNQHRQCVWFHGDLNLCLGITGMLWEILGVVHLGAFVSQNAQLWDEWFLLIFQHDCKSWREKCAAWRFWVVHKAAKQCLNWIICIHDADPGATSE